jgi:hypothetical protein
MKADLVFFFMLSVLADEFMQKATLSCLAAACLGFKGEPQLQVRAAVCWLFGVETASG